MLTTTNVRLLSRLGSTALGLIALAMPGAVQHSFAADTSSPSFESPEQAVIALYTAVKNDDQANLERLIGPLASSDEIARDKADREQFLRKYSEMHRLARQPDGTTILYVGAENWPFPVPLLEAHGRWRFDEAAGTREVTFRRIGEDENAAIQTCLDVENGATLPEKSVNGYQFRAMKTSSGTVALAYPTEYGMTGIMTFAATPAGVIYEKDLGPNTASIAPAMTVYKRNRSWHLTSQALTR